MTTANPVFCAIDSADINAAQTLVEKIAPHVGGLKLGLEFFLAFGTEGYKRMAGFGLPVFLDLKLYDIPNTVAGAIGSLLSLRPDFMTLHASGGKTMMRAAVQKAAETAYRTRLLGVTVLTSMDAGDLSQTGIASEPAAQVVRLAGLAQDSGMDGVICSAEEITPLREKLGKDFILMVPGIRPAWAAANDQKRVMTPRDAMRAGASYLVIGRPITADAHPADAAKRIADELGGEAV